MNGINIFVETPIDGNHIYIADKGKIVSTSNENIVRLYNGEILIMAIDSAVVRFRDEFVTVSGYSHQEKKPIQKVVLSFTPVGNDHFKTPEHGT